MVRKRSIFLSPKINWDEKYKNIKKIIYKLGLRPKDCIFIDDNNIEIQKVKYNQWYKYSSFKKI